MKSHTGLHKMSLHLIQSDDIGPLLGPGWHSFSHYFTCHAKEKLICICEKSDFKFSTKSCKSFFCLSQSACVTWSCPPTWGNSSTLLPVAAKSALLLSLKNNPQLLSQQKGCQGGSPGVLQGSNLSPMSVYTGAVKCTLCSGHNIIIRVPFIVVSRGGPARLQAGIQVDACGLHSPGARREQRPLVSSSSDLH